MKSATVALRSRDFDVSWVLEAAPAGAVDAEIDFDLGGPTQRDLAGQVGFSARRRDPSGAASVATVNALFSEGRAEIEGSVEVAGARASFEGSSRPFAQRPELSLKGSFGWDGPVPSDAPETHLGGTFDVSLAGSALASVSGQGGFDVRSSFVNRGTISRGHVGLDPGGGRRGVAPLGPRREWVLFRDRWDRSAGWHCGARRFRRPSGPGRGRDSGRLDRQRAQRHACWHRKGRVRGAGRLRRATRIGSQLVRRLRGGLGSRRNRPQGRAPGGRRARTVARRIGRADRLGGPGRRVEREGHSWTFPRVGPRSPPTLRAVLHGARRFVDGRGRTPGGRPGRAPRGELRAVTDQQARGRHGLGRGDPSGGRPHVPGYGLVPGRGIPR